MVRRRRSYEGSWSAWAVWGGPGRLTNGGNGIYLARHCMQNDMYPFSPLGIYCMPYSHDDVGGYMPSVLVRHKPWTGPGYRPFPDGILHGNARIACAVRAVSLFGQKCYFRLCLRELKFGLGWLGTEESRRRIGRWAVVSYTADARCYRSWYLSILCLLFLLLRPFLISG